MSGLSCPECNGHVDLLSFHAHHRWAVINPEAVDDVVVCPAGHAVRYGDLMIGSAEDAGMSATVSSG